MGSKIIKQQPIDFNAHVVIQNMPGKQLVLDHIKNIKEIFPNKSDVEINNMVNNAIFRDMAFDAIMDYISTLYEYEFDPADIERIKQFPWFKENVEMMFERQPNLGRDFLGEELAKQEIKKVLLFDELIKELSISYTDAEFEALIEKYYADTNLSIREWKKNPEAREGAKRTLLSEKLINTLITKFVNLDSDLYFARLQEINDNMRRQTHK